MTFPVQPCSSDELEDNRRDMGSDLLCCKNDKEKMSIHQIKDNFKAT
jgi:hypothetical protein